MREDTDGRFWNFVVGAAIGGAISVVSSYISARINGDEYTLADGLSAFAVGAVSGLLTASGLPVAAIAVINGTVAFAGSLTADYFSERNIDIGKAVLSASVAVVGSLWGGNGIRYKTEPYAIAKNAANNAREVAKSAPRGFARKAAKLALRRANSVLEDVYWEQSLIQLGKTASMGVIGAGINSLYNSFID